MISSLYTDHLLTYNVFYIMWCKSIIPQNSASKIVLQRKEKRLVSWKLGLMWMAEQNWLTMGKLACSACAIVGYLQHMAWKLKTQLTWTPKTVCPQHQSAHPTTLKQFTINAKQFTKQFAKTPKRFTNSTKSSSPATPKAVHWQHSKQPFARNSQLQSFYPSTTQ